MITFEARISFEERFGRRSFRLAVVPALALLGLLSCTAPPRPFDPTEVEPLLLALPDAWNARDAEAWVARFDEDSGFTNILGMHFPNRDANEARHAQLFETIFANSTLTAEVLSVRPVGGNGAVAEVGFELVGYERLPPDVEETEPGVLRTRLIVVLERGEGGWGVVAAQNTAVLPAALR